MIPGERIVNATYGKSAVDGVSGLNPGLQEQMKPSETTAAPTIPDNDAEIASIHTNPLRGELADIQSALRRNNVFTGGMQNYRQLLADLIEKHEQIKEPAPLESIAKDFGVDLADVALSEDSDTLLEKIKRAIREIIENDGFLLGVKEKLDAFTTLMAFDLRDVLSVEEYMAEKNMTLELGKFSLVRVQEDMRKALRGQANVNPDAASALLIDTNKNDQPMKTEHINTKSRKWSI